MADNLSDNILYTAPQSTQDEGTNNSTTKSRQDKKAASSSSERSTLLVEPEKQVPLPTTLTDKELGKYSFVQLEKLIQHFTEKKNIVQLRAIEDYIVRCQKVVQEHYTKLINSEGENIQPDGKISFEEMSKEVAGKRYSYTRMYWKENGKKIGRLVPNEPLGEDE